MQITGAIAQIVGRNLQLKLKYQFYHLHAFYIGEIITFEESNISTTLQDITFGNNLNITNRYELDKGQRESFMIIRELLEKLIFLLLLEN